MTAQIIDGRAVAARMKQELAAQVCEMKQRHDGLTPGLAVVLVGEDPASQVYVRNKKLACESVGFRSTSHTLPAATTQDELLALIAQLNADPMVNGILVQLPLPSAINEQMVINAIDPLKDVDGFHPVNIGCQSIGLASLAPCTPSGCMILIEEVEKDLSGKKALVVGRSNIVGKPMASMLLKANCTVTMAHSRTRNLPEECAQADIIIAALGRPAFLRGAWIKEGAIVIDVGINRVTNEETGKSQLVGDVAFDEALPHVGAITPVPGGVGPMTIACLMQNTLKATKMQNGWA
ncbi:MAG: bifunctional methylenetetrahydrofolate dehydrogenase/methenyltetrahydrofolate cyclohydrolase FolD [Alphaproteobacteria bacterium]|nr:bifunctional methylenetetrahydrofolate dehydrogenase/methenyltetrahydrofolate cyclohydrolase FolD [Alphaproteobacteria bacterium]